MDGFLFFSWPAATRISGPDVVQIHLCRGRRPRNGSVATASSARALIGNWRLTHLAQILGQGLETVKGPGIWAAPDSDLCLAGSRCPGQHHGDFQDDALLSLLPPFSCTAFTTASVRRKAAAERTARCERKQGRLGAEHHRRKPDDTPATPENAKKVSGRHKVMLISIQLIGRMADEAEQMRL